MAPGIGGDAARRSRRCRPPLRIPCRARLAGAADQLARKCAIASSTRCSVSGRGYKHVFVHGKFAPVKSGKARDVRHGHAARALFAERRVPLRLARGLRKLSPCDISHSRSRPSVKASTICASVAGAGTAALSQQFDAARKRSRDRLGNGCHVRRPRFLRPAAARVRL